MSLEVAMSREDSILVSVAKYIGLEMGYSVFDQDLIKCINTSFFYLNQLGVGSKKPFSITGEDETWEEFFGEQNGYFDCAKDYVYIRTKRIFDPPASGIMMDALTQEMREIEWRITVMVDELEPSV